MLLAGALCACRGGPWERGDDWTFALTEIASEEWSDGSSEPWFAPSGGGGVEELWIVALVALPVALPIALDLALLPVTLPHDLVVD